MGWLRVGVTLVVLALFTAVTGPLQVVAVRWKWPIVDWVPRTWFRIACWLIGMNVKVEGTVARAPVLIAANHVSWLDIAAISSVLPVSFVAKSEVAAWPVVSFLARMQRSVFVERRRRSATGRAAETIGRRVRDGDIIVLFAEGTTGDGNRVLPFRSALLGAADTDGKEPIAIQPLAIVYTGIRGLPVGRVERPLIAWYGDMDLGPHFARIVGLGALDVVLSFGEPILLAGAADRKVVAEQCYRAVRRMAGDIERRGLSSAGHAGRLFSGGSKSAKGAGEGPLAGAAVAPVEPMTSQTS